MKNVILAASLGYDYAQLYPFVRSLKDTGFDGDIVLFVAATNQDTIQKLQADGILVQRFFYPYRRFYKLRNPLYRLWPFVRPLVAGSKNPDLIQVVYAPFQNLSILRYFLYRRFLKKFHGNYKNVFLTDLRDVYFQDQPFKKIKENELRVFMEEPWLRQGADVNSSRWLREMFGEEMVARLADTTLICSGTILGDIQSMLNYLDAFLLALCEANSVMRMGLDQGIHNHLVYDGKLKNVRQCSNRSAEVFSMGLVSPDEKLPRDEFGKFINQTGELYAVIHQFDRHPEVNQRILSKYQVSGVGENVGSGKLSREFSQ